MDIENPPAEEIQWDWLELDQFASCQAECIEGVVVEPTEAQAAGRTRLPLACKY